MRGEPRRGDTNIPLPGRLCEIVSDPPVLYRHAVEPFPIPLPTPALLGARSLCLNVFHSMIGRKCISAFWAAWCLSLSEPASALARRHTRFHFRSNLGLCQIYAVWPTLAPTGEHGRFSAAIALRVRAVSKSAMEDLKLKFCRAMLAFSSHAVLTQAASLSFELLRRGAPAWGNDRSRSARFLGPALASSVAQLRSTRRIYFSVRRSSAICVTTSSSFCCVILKTCWHGAPPASRTRNTSASSRKVKPIFRALCARRTRSSDSWL